MVRSRASFFAQESLRFAVPEGDWADEIPLPPSLAAAQRRFLAMTHKEKVTKTFSDLGDDDRALSVWKRALSEAQNSYQRLIDCGVPAEEARGVLPHDMPTRIHWVADLRTLLAEAGKRTCTQAQFPWRMIFAGIANALRNHHGGFYNQESFSGGGVLSGPSHSDGWQFREIANRLRPVCYQTGSCGFMAAFDRSCSIRSRVDANAAIGRPSKDWSKTWLAEDPEESIPAINDAEWALDPGAARS
jgi:hypothetical protein